MWAFSRSPGAVFGLPCFRLPETLTFKPLKEQDHLHLSGVGDVHLDLHIYCSLRYHISRHFPLPPSPKYPSSRHCWGPSIRCSLQAVFFPVVCVTAWAAQGKHFQPTASYMGGKAWLLEASFPAHISVICIWSCGKLRFWVSSWIYCFIHSIPGLGRTAKLWVLTQA